MPYTDYVQRGTEPSFTAGPNGTSALIPVETSSKIIQGITQKSSILRLMPHVPMSRHLKDMPVLSSLPTAYWVNGDTGAKQTTSMNWKNVRLIAEELAVVIFIPDVVLKDSEANIWAQIRPKVEEAFGKKLDEAVMFGLDKPASWPLDLKAGAIAAGNTVTDGTGIDVAADINNAMASVEADGFGATGIAMRQTYRSRFRGIRATTGEPIYRSAGMGLDKASFGSGAGATEGSIWDVRSVAVLNGSFEAENVASANAASLFVGDFDQGMIAIREDINVEFSKSAVMHDAAGLVTFNAWQQDMTAGRFTARFAYAVPNPVNRLNETEATRWPWAIIRDAA